MLGHREKLSATSTVQVTLNVLIVFSWLMFSLGLWSCIAALLKSTSKTLVRLASVFFVDV